jgi:flavin reductase (DIM6/NTAB) family NADH-FMN oxidoreductase RutF
MVFHSATDPAELRRCLGQFATGVTIVACRAGNARHGATVNAFSAVSLDPPLVLVALDRRSKVCAYLEGQPFSVTVLGADESRLAPHFAGQARAWPEPQWIDSGCVPRLAGGVAHITCRPWTRYDAGDHVLYLGEVQEFSYQADADPLLYHCGLLRSFGAFPGDSVWPRTLDSPESGLTWRPPR